MQTTTTAVDWESRDQRRGAHRFEYDTMVTSPSVAVISAVADVLEVAPTKLGPFQDAVDSDALDGLFRDGSGVESPVTVSFRYEECDVTASSAGFVSVAPDSGADGGER